jgi:hypothetical protein
VKPGGMVFFSTLNRNAKSFLFAIVGAEYVLNLLPRGTHEYARFIRPSELSRACREAGLTVADLTGMTYNPFTKTYALGRDVDVNYLMGRSVIDAVLFDLDGTLADTAPDMARTVNLMRTNRGLAAVPPAVVRPHVSQGARGMIMSAFGSAPTIPDFVAMRTEFLDLYAATSASTRSSSREWTSSSPASTARRSRGVSSPTSSSASPSPSSTRSASASAPRW